uniref:Secreted protein n=1 Tax=Anopheles minimus TaxID=112268 RepID=A0A3F2Z117_9DIPT
MNPRLVFVFCCIALHLKLVTCLPPLFGSAILGGREEKPLLAMSLESGEADTEQATSSVDRIDDEEDEFYPLKGYHLRRITSSKRFYATVLGVLQVLESQARQKVLRAREQQENVRSAYGEEDKQPA